MLIFSKLIITTPKRRLLLTLNMLICVVHHWPAIFLVLFTTSLGCPFFIQLWIQGNSSIWVEISQYFSTLMHEITVDEDTVKEKNILLVRFNGGFRNLSGKELRKRSRAT